MNVVMNLNKKSVPKQRQLSTRNVGQVSVQRPKFNSLLSDLISNKNVRSCGCGR
jgi:hypothetical protein